MIFKKEESVITKRVKVLVDADIGRDYNKNTYQKFLRTTYKFLFIPIYTYDERI